MAGQWLSLKQLTDMAKEKLKGYTQSKVIKGTKKMEDSNGK